MIQIALFASGAGSNAAVIINSIHNYISNKDACIALIVTNNSSAGVLNIAKQHNISSEIVNLKGKSDVETAKLYLNICHEYSIDYIILAGYLKKIPSLLIKKYPEKIINIHPSLLPKYGGVGMYGMHVHEAVIAAKEKYSGITIHFVDEIYDHGKVIFQANCAVEALDTAMDLSKKIQQLEHENFTKTIATILGSQNRVK